MPGSSPLDGYLGSYRLLLVLAPSVQSPAFEQQMEQLSGTDDERAARDLLVGRILYEGESRIGTDVVEAEVARALRAHFDVDDEGFLAVLVGKDGTVEGTYEAPVAAAAVFGAIDGRPSGEMRGGHD